MPNPSCGTCYHLQFTGTGKFNANDPGSKAIAGKHMIVKVANSGGDVAGNQFDLAVPGGGVGLNANTCTSQWKLSSSDLGPTAGGFLSACTGTHDQKMSCVREKCNKLPDGNARKGCLWFVDWFQVADDPNFRYEPIACPSDIGVEVVVWPAASTLMPVIFAFNSSNGIWRFLETCNAAMN